METKTNLSHQKVHELVAAAYKRGWRDATERARGWAETLALEPSSGVVSEYTRTLPSLILPGTLPTSKLRKRELRIIWLAAQTVVDPHPRGDIPAKDYAEISKKLVRGFAPLGATSGRRLLRLGPVKPGAIDRALEEFEYARPKDQAVIAMCEAGILTSTSAAAKYGKMTEVEVRLILHAARVKIAPVATTPQPRKLSAAQKRLVKLVYLLASEEEDSVRPGPPEADAADQLRAGGDVPNSVGGLDVDVQFEAIEGVSPSEVLKIVDGKFLGSNFPLAALEAVVLAERGAFNSMARLSATVGVSSRTITRWLDFCRTKFVPASKV